MLSASYRQPARQSSKLFIFCMLFGALAFICSESHSATRKVRISLNPGGRKVTINVGSNGGGISITGPQSSGGRGGGGGGASGPPAVAVSAASCKRIVDISSLRNVLYKSENLHGSRGMTMLFQNAAERPGKSRIEMRNCSCNVKVGTFGLYATDYPYGARYYQQTGGSGNQLGPIIAKLKSKCMLVEGKGKWIRVPDVTKRSGSITK